MIRTRRSLVAAACLAVICLAGGLAAQGPTPLGSAAISGVVVDAVTGRPLAGAVVSLANLDLAGSQFPRMVTDSQGRFVFRDLRPSGGYWLGSRRFGYAYTRYGWTSPDGSLATKDIARIALKDKDWVNTIRIPLWRLGSINGRVVDERNEPVVGAAVRAFSTRSIAGQPQLVAGPIVVTDDVGAYRLADLDPARYVVAVLSVQSTVLATTPDVPQIRAIGELATGGIGAGGPSSVSVPTVDVDGRHRLAITNFVTPPPPAGDRPRAYPPVFYPNVRNAEQALAIEIGYGDARNAIDFQLQPVAVGAVTGRLDGIQIPASPMLLRLLPVGSERLGFGSEVATTVVEPDGGFTFLNVPEGEYTLLAQGAVMDFTTGNESIRFPDAPGFPGGGISVGSMSSMPGLGYLARQGAASAFWGRTPVSVGAGGATNVVVGMRQTTTVRGRLVFTEGTQPPPAGRVMLMTAQPANGDPSLGQPLGTVTADPGRAFELRGLLAGTYVVNTVGAYQIVSLMVDGRDVKDVGLDASRGQNIDDVVITLTDKVAKLKGVVHDDQGPAIAGVIVFPTDRKRWVNYGWRPTALQSTRSGSDGSYDFQSLPAGEYFAVAVDGSQVDAWVDAAFLAAASTQASRIQVDWGEAKTLGLAKVKVVVK